MALDTTASGVGTSAPVAASTNPHHAKRWWILTILAIAQLMVVLDSTVVSIALPHAQTDLGFSSADRQWIVTAYALSFGSLLLVGGRIADIFGRKWTLIIGLVGFAVASAIGGASVDFAMLVIARAVQGAFGALLAPAALSLLTTTFTEAKERAKAFGIYGGIAGAGASVGLLLGGILTEYLDWRWTMYVNLIFAVIALFGSLTLLHHSTDADRPKLDVVGTIVVCASMFGIVYGFSNVANVAESHPNDATAGWHSGTTLGFLIAGVVLLVAFVLWERRVANPLLPLRIVTDRNRGGAYMAMFLASVGMFGVFLFLTYYLEETIGFSPVKAGLAYLPMTGLIVVVAGVGSTVLAPRVSPRLLIPSGMLIAALGLVLLTRIGVQSDYAGTVLPAILVMAVGLGLVFAPAFSMGTLGVRPEDSGVASATVNVMQQIGGAIGTAVLNTLALMVASNYLGSHHATTKAQLAQVAVSGSVHSYIVAFWWSAAIFAVGGVLAALILRSGVPDYDENEGVVAL